MDPVYSLCVFCPIWPLAPLVLIYRELTAKSAAKWALDQVLCKRYRDNFSINTTATLQKDEPLAWVQTSFQHLGAFQGTGICPAHAVVSLNSSKIETPKPIFDTVTTRNGWHGMICYGHGIVNRAI